MFCLLLLLVFFKVVFSFRIGLFAGVSLTHFNFDLIKYIGVGGSVEKQSSYSGRWPPGDGKDVKTDLGFLPRLVLAIAEVLTLMGTDICDGKLPLILTLFQSESDGSCFMTRDATVKKYKDHQNY